MMKIAPVFGKKIREIAHLQKILDWTSQENTVLIQQSHFLAGIYLLKVTKKTLEQGVKYVQS